VVVRQLVPPLDELVEGSNALLLPTAGQTYWVSPPL
jgi:hypothetical protein